MRANCMQQQVEPGTCSTLACMVTLDWQPNNKAKHLHT